jgi:hypothetical protein
MRVLLSEMKDNEIENFEIIVDKQFKRVYIGGEELKGNLKLKICKRLKITNLKLIFKGKGLFNWNKKFYNCAKVSTQNFAEEEEYLNLEVINFVKITVNDFYLEVGEEVFSFEIKLPTTLPTSFDDENARIRYSLEANIDGYVNNLVPFSKKTNLTIIIVNPVDLNLNASTLLQPVTVEKTKIINCLLSSPIEIYFQIFKTGYVPGETIKFVSVINNKTSFNLKKVTCLFVQMLTCKTEDNECNFRKIVIKQKSNIKFNKNSSIRWNGTLKIPPICASSDNKSKIIDISYRLELLVKPTLIHKSISLLVPIIIGTKPLINQSSSLQISEKNLKYKFEPVYKIKGRIENSDSNMSLYYPFYDNIIGKN